MFDTNRAAERLNRLCPPCVRSLLDIFATAGVGAYPVGGCVRDALMERIPHDWDIAVTCPPEQTVSLCASAGLITIPTGLVHGTVTVLVPTNTPDGRHMQVECTTCRTEEGYTDGRHPDSVHFSERIQDDLSRRDFTVNAMAAERDATGHFRIMDLFGGLNDLANGVIRCVGNPETRLREDALRVLRGVRFSVKLGFSPEPATRAALISCGEGLARVSGERIREEMRGILTSPSPNRGVLMLYGLGLLPHILPVSPTEAETLARRGGFAGLGGFETALAALLWGLSEPELTADLTRLRLSREQECRVRARLRLAGWKPETGMPLSEIARRLRHSLSDDAVPALNVRQVYTPLPEEVSGLADAVCRSASTREPVTLRELALNGRDVAALGISDGQEIGCVLAKLMDSVLRTPTLNTPEALTEIVREYMRQGKPGGTPITDVQVGAHVKFM